MVKRYIPVRGGLQEVSDWRDYDAFVRDADYLSLERTNAELAERVAVLERERGEADEALAACQSQGGAIKAERDRLREAVEKAPHDADCRSGLPMMKTVQGIGGYGQQATGEYHQCDCWKSRALRGEDG